MELLQIATAQFIAKYDGLLLQIATDFLLQSATWFITNCDRYYKVRWIYYKLRQVLQSAMIVTNCDSTDVANSVQLRLSIPSRITVNISCISCDVAGTQEAPFQLHSLLLVSRCFRTETGYSLPGLVSSSILDSLQSLYVFVY